MAAVTHGQVLASTSNASSYTTASFTPAAGDLLVVFVAKSASLVDGTVTDSLGGTYTLYATANKASGNDECHVFIANQLTNGSARTITYDCAGDAATGCFIFVARVSGMTRIGVSAGRQSAAVNTGGAGTTPAPTFGVACLTGNPTLGLIFNETSPAGMTPPTGWTEPVADQGIAQPTSGAEYVARNSGFTGTTVTWGSTSASAFAALVLELDSTTAPTGPKPGTLAMLGAGR